MSNKTTECYAAVFDFIENNIFELKPAEFISDFEYSLRNAINARYPNSILRGCWYHYCSAIRKKCLQLGMFSLIKCNSNAKATQQKLMSLPLLPAERFDEGYSHIKRFAIEHRLANQFKHLFVYFENYWFTQVSI